MKAKFVFSGEAARQAGIQRGTLLMWESRGHLPPAERIQIGPGRLDRIYTPADVKRIIQLAKQRGLVDEREVAA